MLPFGVTIPATVPQRSEIREVHELPRALCDVTDDSTQGRCKAVAGGATRFIFAVGSEICYTGPENNVQDNCKFRL